MPLIKVKQVSCINPKTYNLTKGKTYKVVMEMDGRYRIENDNKLVRAYSTSLFEIVEDENLFTPKVLMEGFIPMWEDEKMFGFLDENMKTHFFELELPVIVEMQCCGLVELAGINDFAAAVDRQMMSLACKDVLFQEALSYAITYDLKFRQIFPGRVIITTQKQDNRHYLQIKRRLSDKGGLLATFINPNTHNDIHMWTIDVNKFRIDESNN